MSAGADLAAFLLWPLLAGVAALASHVPLGRVVLARGIVFVDLAIAQVAGFGALVGHMAGVDSVRGATQLCAVSFALAAALALAWTDRRVPRLQEALIGTLFVGTASLALLLIATDAHGAGHLRDLLVGQILFAGPADLVPLVAAALLVAFALARGWLARGGIGFYVAFALAVTASVQVIGVYVVFATLIAPALAASAFTERRAAPMAITSGIAGYLAGVSASVWGDWPTGPCIVLALIATTAAFALVGRAGAARED
ncbi:MAG: metal ABC transporter permease [Alphaproteobacteria bacterium]|nr:metal ABC transporter permease [Alphaproteobacteria bacterium]